MKNYTLFLVLVNLFFTMLPEQTWSNNSSDLPIDSVSLSPDYYDKAYILSYMDISVFFAKDIDTINGKFYMAPEGVTIASTPEFAHNSASDYYYQTGQSAYLYYCDSIEIRSNNEVFIPYENYFSLYEHHLKYNTKYNLLFVGEMTFSDGSKYTNTESDVLAEFNTAPIPDNKMKEKGTFRPADIPNIGFSKKYLEDPTSDRYVNATYGKTAIHNLPPVSAAYITGKNINVAIVDLQIYRNTLVDKAVVFRSHPLEDELFIEKDKIAPLSLNPDSILPLYNHGTQMARYMLNYAPEINIYNYNKLAEMNDVFPDSMFAASIMDPVNEIDIASFSGSSSAIDDLAEAVHDGLIMSRSLGNDRSVTNTFDDTKSLDLFLPHNSPYLTGANRESMKGAFVTLQGVIFDCFRPGPVEDLDISTAYSVRSGAGDAQEYTLSVIENGIGATSEATATFSGMVALMLEANEKYGSTYSPREVVEIMFQTAIDIGTPGVDSIFGWGVPDLGAAFEHIKNQEPVTFDLYGVNEVSIIPPIVEYIDSVSLSPDYYTDKTYILSYMDISVFFAKNISAINGKFYMAPENVSIASTPIQAHRPNYDYPYQIGYSNYLYYCDSIEIRNNNEIFIPYINYFSSSEHHLKYDTKYNLLFVGDITFSDGSNSISTESDIIAQFNTASVPDKRIKAKGTFTVADIANIGFSKEYLDDPFETKFSSAIYGKTAIHNLTPLSDITGKDINVAIVDLQIYKNSLVDKAVVYRSHPLEDEMFVSKDIIAALTLDIDSILPLYNHGTQMARYMLNYAPKINIFSFNNAQIMRDVFTDSLMAATIMDPTLNIDIASFSGSSTAIEALAEGVHDGLVMSCPLGDYGTVTNTFDDTQNKDLFLPYNSPYLTGDSRVSMKGAFVTLQGVIFDCFRPGPVEDLDISTAYSIRSGAGDAQEYTLSVIENGTGGTSEATATFSGMVALMLEANKKYGSTYSPREVVEIMFQTAIDIGTPGVDSIFGWGVPDLGAALEHIKNQEPVTFDLYGVNEADSTTNGLNIEDAFEVKIFPNPSTQNITIYFNSIEKGLSEIKLFDLSGKEVLAKEIKPETSMIELNMSHLPSGIFLVHLYLENGTMVSRKIIKK